MIRTGEERWLAVVSCPGLHHGKPVGCRTFGKVVGCCGGAAKEGKGDEGEGLIVHFEVLLKRSIVC